MVELIDFLRARLDEDEDAAKRAPMEDWWGSSVMDGAHIGRWLPARVLAEVEAKRRIINRHVRKANEEHIICAECGGREWKPEGGVLAPFPWVMPWPCPTLRLLALPHLGHPDYREEWRP